MREIIQLAVKPGDFFKKKIELTLDKMPYLKIAAFLFWFNIVMNKIYSLWILLIVKNIFFIILTLLLLYVYIKIAYYITYKFYNFRIKLSWWDSNELLSKKIILYSNIFINFFYSLSLLITFLISYNNENFVVNNYFLIFWLSIYYLLIIHSIFISYKWLTNNIKINKYKSTILFIILPIIFYLLVILLGVASILEV